MDAPICTVTKKNKETQLNAALLTVIIKSHLFFVNIFLKHHNAFHNTSSDQIFTQVNGPR